MKLWKIISRRSFLNEVVYIGLNLGLALAILLVTRSLESFAVALALVLLSKWRVLSVRPRYWLVNILANLVDVVVGVSVVMLTYQAVVGGYDLAVQIGLTVFYAVWLLGLKPRSTRKAMAWQALIALGVGAMTLFVFSYAIPVVVMVLAMAGLGYVTARHILSQYEEDHLQFLSLTWAFILAEVTWLLAHLTISYQEPFFGIRFPQALIVVMSLAIVFFTIYRIHKEAPERPKAAAWRIGIATGLALLSVVLFSQISSSTM